MDQVVHQQQIKLEKNKIASYKSRIGKRFEVEKLRATLDRLYKVIEEEVPES